MRLVAVDTETTGLYAYNGDRPFAVSWAFEDGTTGFVRFPVFSKSRRVLYHRKGVKIVQDLLSDPGNKIIMHNASFDLKMLAAAGFDLPADVHDSKTLMHIATGGSEPTYSLKPLCKKYFKVDNDDQKDLHKSIVAARRMAKKRGLPTSDDVMADCYMGDPDLLERYAREDAHRTMLLWKFAVSLCKKNSQAIPLYNDIEVPVAATLRRMEARGARVYTKVIKSLRSYYGKEIRKAMEVFRDEGYPDLNPNSPQQLQRVLFQDRNLQPRRWTATGAPSCDKETINYLASVEQDAVAIALREHRVASKSLSGFVEPYARLAVPEGNIHVLHPNYNATGARTGRLSCSDPNLQQVADPKKEVPTNVKNRARELLGPRPGYVWLLCDYSQIEVWLFAFLSGETTMQKALLGGEDFHAFNATTIWGDRPDFQEHFKHYRKRGKIVMFCKLYGGGVGAVALQASVPEKEAREFVADFEARLPGVPKFIDRMYNRAQRNGYIDTPFGRRYYFNGGDEYKAVNYIIQGTASDVMKCALIDVDEMLRVKYPTSHLLLTVHDEVVIEVPVGHLTANLVSDVKTAMQSTYDIVGLPVPFPVDAEVATECWAKVVPIEEYLDAT